MKGIRGRKGQSTTEYMLLISVIVIAIVAAGYVFVPVFQAGVSSLGDDVSSSLSDGHLRPGSGAAPSGGGGGSGE